MLSATHIHDFANLFENFWKYCCNEMRSRVCFFDLYNVLLLFFLTFVLTINITDRNLNLKELGSFEINLIIYVSFANHLTLVPHSFFCSLSCLSLFLTLLYVHCISYSLTPAPLVLLYSLTFPLLPAFLSLGFPSSLHSCSSSSFPFPPSCPSLFLPLSPSCPSSSFPFPPVCPSLFLPPSLPPVYPSCSFLSLIFLPFPCFLSLSFLHSSSLLTLAFLSSPSLLPLAFPHSSSLLSLTSPHSLSWI